MRKTHFLLKFMLMLTIAAVVSLLSSKQSQADHVTNNGWIQTSSGAALDSGITTPKKSPFGRTKHVVDLQRISFANLNLLAFSVFGAKLDGVSVNTGNQFADRRANDQQRAEFSQLSDALYHGITPENLVFGVFGAPIQLGRYDFDNKTFSVCLPSIWETRIPSTFNLNLRQLAFYSDKGAGAQCEFSGNGFLASTVQQHDYAAYAARVAMPMNSDDQAEALFNSSQEKPLSADVFCGAPFPVRPNELHAYNMRCTITYVKFYQDGKQVAEIGYRPSENVESNTLGEVSAKKYGEATVHVEWMRSLAGSAAGNVGNAQYRNATLNEGIEVELGQKWPIPGLDYEQIAEQLYEVHPSQVVTNNGSIACIVFRYDRGTTLKQIESWFSQAYGNFDRFKGQVYWSDGQTAVTVFQDSIGVGAMMADMHTCGS